MTDTSTDPAPDVETAGPPRGARAFVHWLRDPARHGVGLAAAAAAALADGRPRAAFRYADRLCRLSAAPPADHLALKGAALSALGLPAAAREAAEAALARDPAHETAMILTLREGLPEARRAAAEALVARPGAPAVTAFARRVLERDGAAPDIAAPDVAPRAAPAPASDAPPPPAADVAVIVPVYADADATRDCLESLARSDFGDLSVRLIVVDDASPDPAVKALIASLDPDGVEVLVNPANLGFAGSVNRALRRTSREDVVLLNADTVVPRHWLTRLHAVARRDPTIGAVTPFSNNGELTSVPAPFHANPMPGADTIERIAEAAHAANDGALVELPSGVGFCLYVTRACLDVVGEVPSGFGRGYGEDVALCLLAAERGFRSVCAPSVYVAHAGARSFKALKRPLVMRNLARLEFDFPDHRGACNDFVAADPLAPFRAPLERAEMAGTGPIRLLVAEHGGAEDVAAARSRALEAEGRRSALLRDYRDGRGRLIALDGAAPQTLRYDLNDAADATLLRADLERLGVDRVEFIGPAIDGPAAAALAPLALPRDVLATGFGAFLGRGRPAEGRLILPATAKAARPLGLMPDETFGDATPITPARGEGLTLGLAILQPTARASATALALAAAVAACDRPVTLVAIGETLDDRRFMAAPGCFATGPLRAADGAAIAALFDLHRIDATFLPPGPEWYGAPLFDHLVRDARPLAAHRGTLRRARAGADDLVLDHDDPARAAGVVLAWLIALAERKDAAP